MTLSLFDSAADTQKNIVNNALHSVPPPAPGVYTMYDRHDRVIYIGKAKNLKNRIYSYRYTRNKKARQMLAGVARIGFEVCKTETDAILLENLLIRSIRPPFNTVNKKPETYYYISSTRNGNKREFRLTMKPLHNYQRCYGCFKGHNRVRRGLGALLKFLYVMDKPLQNTHFLPARLVNRYTPLRFILPVTDELSVRVHQLLEGSSDLFLGDCRRMIDTTRFIDLFSERYFEKELELLQTFFTLGPERNQLIKTTLGLDYTLIPQNELDDLQVLYSNTVSEKHTAQQPG